MTASVLAPHRATFRAFAETVIPEMADLDAAGWNDVERTVEHALAGRPARMRRQLGMLLRAIDALSRVRHARRFAALDAQRRTSLLDMLEHSPVKLLRRGVWGLRTLVLMGYYTRDEVMNAVGYRAHVHGWDARADQNTVAQPAPRDAAGEARP